MAVCYSKYSLKWPPAHIPRYCFKWRQNKDASVKFTSQPWNRTPHSGITGTQTSLFPHKHSLVFPAIRPGHAHRYTIHPRPGLGLQSCVSFNVLATFGLRAVPCGFWMPGANAFKRLFLCFLPIHSSLYIISIHFFLYRMPTFNKDVRRRLRSPHNVPSLSVLFAHS